MDLVTNPTIQKWRILVNISNVYFINQRWKLITWLNSLVLVASDNNYKDLSTCGALHSIGSDVTRTRGKSDGYQNGSVRSEETMSKGNENGATPVSRAEPVASRESFAQLTENGREIPNNNDDGNLLDALAAAIKAALSNTGLPKVQVSLPAASDEQPEVDISDEEFLQFDTSAVPVIVTLTKVGKHYIVDATTEEESQMSSAVSVSINRQGRICGMTKRGGAGLDPSVILDMISVASHVSGQLIDTLDSEIAVAEAREEDES